MLGSCWLEGPWGGPVKSRFREHNALLITINKIQGPHHCTVGTLLSHNPERGCRYQTPRLHVERARRPYVTWRDNKGARTPSAGLGPDLSV
jgi:hypothetical protein